MTAGDSAAGRARFLRLTAQLTRRDIRNRYLGSFSGLAWALLQPLLQLAVYAFVFAYIFKARVPGADAPGYVPFLIVAMWPWLAFAEAVQRGATAIQDNAALLGKVSLPRPALVVAPVLASFVVHGAGFAAILVVLAIAGMIAPTAGVALIVPVFAGLFVFALAIALLLAALQVFVRDIAPALPQLMMIWMFVSPIFYAREVLPERYRGLLDFNPYTAFAEYFRHALLGMPAPELRTCVVAIACTLLAALLGWHVFRRLETHFEDFL
jgi:ABC-type polysaccharide/polyol phosphate export permease